MSGLALLEAKLAAAFAFLAIVAYEAWRRFIRRK